MIWEEGFCLFVFGIWNYKFTELNRLREEGAKHTHNKNSNMDFFQGCWCSFTYHFFSLFVLCLIFCILFFFLHICLSLSGNDFIFWNSVKRQKKGKAFLELFSCMIESSKRSFWKKKPLSC